MNKRTAYAFIALLSIVIMLISAAPLCAAEAEDYFFERADILKEFGDNKFVADLMSVRIYTEEGGREIHIAAQRAKNDKLVIMFYEQIQGGLYRLTTDEPDLSSQSEVLIDGDEFVVRFDADANKIRIGPPDSPIGFLEFEYFESPMLFADEKTAETESGTEYSKPAETSAVTEPTVYVTSPYTSAPTVTIPDESPSLPSFPKVDPSILNVMIKAVFVLIVVALIVLIVLTKKGMLERKRNKETSDGDGHRKDTYLSQSRTEEVITEKNATIPKVENSGKKEVVKKDPPGFSEGPYSDYISLYADLHFGGVVLIPGSFRIGNYSDLRDKATLEVPFFMKGANPRYIITEKGYLVLRDMKDLTANPTKYIGLQYVFDVKQGSKSGNSVEPNGQQIIEMYPATVHADGQKFVLDKKGTLVVR